MEGSNKMMLLIIAILITLGTAFLWFMTLASDPSNTQASSDAARHILFVGLPIAGLFWAGWWFGW
jgi:hypothetical protein